MQVVHRHRNLRWTTSPATQQGQLSATFSGGSPKAERSSSAGSQTRGGCSCQHDFTKSLGKEVCLKCGASRDLETNASGSVTGSPGPVPRGLRRGDGFPLSPEVVRALQSRASGPLCERTAAAFPGPGAYEVTSAFGTPPPPQRPRRPASAGALGRGCH